LVRYRDAAVGPWSANAEDIYAVCGARVGGERGSDAGEVEAVVASLVTAKHCTGWVAGFAAMKREKVCVV